MKRFFLKLHPFVVYAFVYSVGFYSIWIPWALVKEFSPLWLYMTYCFAGAAISTVIGATLARFVCPRFKEWQRYEWFVLSLNRITERHNILFARRMEEK